jgi:hypothetical protein
VNQVQKNLKNFLMNGSKSKLNIRDDDSTI